MSFENTVVLQSHHGECQEDGESMGADGLHIDDQVDLLSLDNLLEDMDQVLIAEFFHTWRNHLEEEEKKMHHLSEVVERVSQKKPKREFGPERAESKSKSKQLLTEVIEVTEDPESASSEDEDLSPPKELKPINEENNEFESGSVLKTGSQKLSDSGPTEIQEEQKGQTGKDKKGAFALVDWMSQDKGSVQTVVLTEEEKEKKAKEKKKLMEIIGKVLAKINSKEQREKAKKVIGSIVEKSENMGSVMGLLGDKMVKNKKVFGSNIEDILKNEKNENRDIPRFLETALKVVQSPDKIVVEGIYRQNGNMALIQALKVDVEHNKLDKLEKVTNVHNLTGLIKLFFKELNVPLFNPEWYEKITTVVKKDEQSKTRENRQEELRDLFKDVSVEKKKTLWHLMKHFDEVKEKEETNKMGLMNLAIVFGPTFSRIDPQSKTLAADVLMQNQAARLMIEDEDCRRALKESVDNDNKKQ